MTEAAGDPIDDAMLFLQRAFVKHPIAAQAIYHALVREGRAYARTDEGRVLRECLLRSDAVGRLRTAWDIITCGLVTDEPPRGAIPSVLLEALARALFRPAFEARLHASARRSQRQASGR
jgi:hypothetical protein